MSVKAMREFERLTKEIEAETVRQKAVQKATKGLTLAELQGLTPTKLRACGRMVQILKDFCQQYQTSNYISQAQMFNDASVLLKELEESAHEV